MRIDWDTPSVGYDCAVNDLTAFVLAGGHSSLMGEDKALLKFGDRSLLQHALSITGELGGRAYIVGPKQRYAEFGEVIEDIYQGCGPLAGIHAALNVTRTALNLILSVDMP